jgi:hypothetical protein
MVCLFWLEIGITVLCAYTLQQVVHTQGYLIDIKVILQAAVLTILAVRIWMPFESTKEIKPEESFEDS